MQKTLYITILILISKEAYAYLDPGSATFILQSILLSKNTGEANT